MSRRRVIDYHNVALDNLEDMVIICHAFNHVGSCEPG
jgi:hypothetical protein